MIRRVTRKVGTLPFWAFVESGKLNIIALVVSTPAFGVFV
jgi:hypothetical protein